MAKTADDKAKAKKAAKKAAAERALLSQALIKNLRQDSDLLAPLPSFRKFQRNGLRLDIAYSAASALPPALQQWAFALTKRNVGSLYESCPGWGWSDSKKKKELEDDNARFIVATFSQPPAEAAPAAGNGNAKSGAAAPAGQDSASLPSPAAAGFVHLRYEMEESEPVLYVYEIQVEECVQGKGLGRFLMQVCELIARRAGLARVMLTVFKANAAAGSLYAKLGYVLHDDSPGAEDPTGDHGYEILTKRLPLPPPAATV